MKAPLIMIVDDDPGVRKVLNYSLTAEGYTTCLANDAEQALEIIKQHLPDLILLDWMMPGLSGLDMMKHLRANKVTRNIPIIMLTAKVTEDDQVKGLLEGADDYISKPFSIRELNARIRSLLRRVKPHITKEKITYGRLVLEPENRSVSLNGVKMIMGTIEFRLLHFFITHPNRIYSRTQILDHVWGINQFIQERTVDVHILRLRKTLSTQGLGDLIKTVRGLGYSLSDSLND